MTSIFLSIIGLIVWCGKYLSSELYSSCSIYNLNCSLFSEELDGEKN